MKTNILALSFRKVAATAESAAYLVGELRVDGARLGEEYVLDVCRLADALSQEGEHFIFTCGCGDAGCAGIFEGVSSRISGGKVWLVGVLPKGGAFSYVLSMSQARKSVKDAILAEEPLIDSCITRNDGESPMFGFEQASNLKVFMQRLHLDVEIQT